MKGFVPKIGRLTKGGSLPENGLTDAFVRPQSASNSTSGGVQKPVIQNGTNGRAKETFPLNRSGHNGSTNAILFANMSRSAASSVSAVAPGETPGWKRILDV